MSTEIIKGHFSACGNEPGFNLAIVAVIEYKDGYSKWNSASVRDWAAYEGATPFNGWTEQRTMEWVAENGNKLSEKQAKFYFPSLPMRKYRS